MSRNLVAAMLAVLIITALTGLVPAQEPTTQPAAPPKPAAKWPNQVELARMVQALRAQKGG